MGNSDDSTNQLVVFSDDQLSLEVRVSPKEDTVWLTQAQIAELFEKTPQNITMHIRNIYADEELDRISTCKDFLHVQKEGGRDIERSIKHYNLDLIISVGYRVKSKRGIAFRKWAGQVLKDYLIKGVVLNRAKLDISKIHQITKILERTADKLDTHQILDVIGRYSRALMLLDDYDHERIQKPEGKPSVYKLNYSECRKIIDDMSMNESSRIFGVEKDESFKSSISTIYQTIDGNDIYPSLQEKAANLLYLITKNHSFVDGNKRIAATIFLIFLDKNNTLYTINHEKTIADDTLVSLTIMIAESRSREKETMINLVMNCLMQ